MYEKIKNPDHYDGDKMTVIDVIGAFDCNFNVGNIIKYVLRAGKKPGESHMEDLKKAKQYLEFEIQRISPSTRGLTELARRDAISRDIVSAYPKDT